MNVLTALKDLYEALSSRGELPSFGWSPIKICCTLDLSETGELSGVTRTFEASTTARGKSFSEPAVFRLPAATARGTSFYPNFLWDNAAFALGLDINANAYRAQRSFQAFRELHHQLLDGLHSPISAALLRFLDLWSPDQAPEVLADVMEDLMLGRNLTFTVSGEPLTSDPAIRDAWDRYYSLADGPDGQCLITGAHTTTILTHPFIRKLDGAQPSGAKLVSFKADAFCSHDHTQGENASVSKYGAFAYSAALNYLLDDRKFSQTVAVGDTTVVFWAVGADPMLEERIYEIMRVLLSGELPSPDESLLSTEVCLLGLDPNAARISVRFFLRKRLGTLFQHVRAHHQRMEIAKAPYERLEQIPLRWLFDDLVPSRRSLPSPVKVATLQALLTGTPYPYALPLAALTRIKAERSVTCIRAAVLKAYYLQNPDPHCPEEILTVALNDSAQSTPYLLGRFFSAAQTVQEAISPVGSVTIRDHYFTSMLCAPAAIFPALNSQCSTFLEKLNARGHGLSHYLVSQVNGLLTRLPERLPAALDAAEQSAFCLGYYHQTQHRYTKKDVK